MQPQQGCQRSDGRDFRPQVRPDHVGIDQRFADQPFRIGGLYGQCVDHHRRHVVHHRREECREESHQHGSGEQPLVGPGLYHNGEECGQPHVLKPVHHHVHAD